VAPTAITVVPLGAVSSSWCPSRWEVAAWLTRRFSAAFPLRAHVFFTQNAVTNPTTKAGGWPTLFPHSQHFDILGSVSPGPPSGTAEVSQDFNHLERVFQPQDLTFTTWKTFGDQRVKTLIFAARPLAAANGQLKLAANGPPST